MTTGERSFSRQIKSLGLIIDDVRQLEELEFLKTKFQLSGEDIHLIWFGEKPEDLNIGNAISFSDDDIGFTGKLKKEEIQDFSLLQLDVLVNFIEEDSVLVNLLVAASQASLKAGRNHHKEDLYDLVIRNGKEVDVFTSELVKYLEILIQKE